MRALSGTWYARVTWYLVSITAVKGYGYFIRTRCKTETSSIMLGTKPKPLLPSSLATSGKWTFRGQKAERTGWELYGHLSPLLSVCEWPCSKTFAIQYEVCRVLGLAGTRIRTSYHESRKGTQQTAVSILVVSTKPRTTPCQYSNYYK